MDYNYEALDEKRFQKLCQALIAAEYPNTQCFPVGQPDGGRDAISPHIEPDSDGFIVFQVKFSTAPQSKTERDQITSVVESEFHKVKKLIDRGAKHYCLITNVQGTGHLDTGSIDRANTSLTDSLTIPTQVWWRDDLDRRLERSDNVKWHYLEIFKATDIFPLLIKNPEDQQATRALRSYIATQYDTDSDVKFKQVELQRNLTEMFVDLPIGRKQPRSEQDIPELLHVRDLDRTPEDLDSIEFEEVHEFFEYFDEMGLAAENLLRIPLRKGVTRLVIEGAPGQGKSTVTQYLCQVNRLRFLQKNYELESVAVSHKATLARVPFRVDLRDYAAWMVTQEFIEAEEKHIQSPNVATALERFLVRQIENNSGGLHVTVDGLLQILSQSHSVVVLDGFDEVADISTRERIVTEICAASSRLDAHVESMVIVVTSRPAAFANSPGFPETDWLHLELRDLRRDNIRAYKDKWIDAQRLTAEEGRLVSETLHDKLEQPHLRDLARNPMQLTILLHLIHVQGVALPEKRTILYDEYMKLFFNREAEKSPIVRDQRELILSIHGVLAWLLHTQAEDGVGSGSIAKTALHEAVRSYLIDEEHNPNLAEELLHGTVERVGALVERRKGMFEFEVQPLREYFTARHLYTTAPQQPAARDCSGTRPERFQAIARSSYWTNVTRFFCGFYNVGELASLVDGVAELGEDEERSLLSQPRRLAMMLLADRVFTQAPRMMKRLIGLLAEEPAFYRFTAMTPFQRRRDMALPANAGGSLMYEACCEKLPGESSAERRTALREIMAQNAGWEVRKSTWIERFHAGEMRCDPIREAIDLEIINRFTASEIENLVGEDREAYLQWLVRSGQYKAIEDNQELLTGATQRLFNGDLFFPLRRKYQVPGLIALEVLSELLRPYGLASLFSDESRRGPAYRVLSRIGASRGRSSIELARKNLQEENTNTLNPFALLVLDLLSEDVRSWRTSLKLWEVLVNGGLRESSENRLMIAVALISTAVDGETDVSEFETDGFAVTEGLVSRLYFARQKGKNVKWWRTRLLEMNSDTSIQGLTILLCWGSSRVISSLFAEIELKLNELSVLDWNRLYGMVKAISWTGRQGRLDLGRFLEREKDRLSCRMAVALGHRFRDKQRAKEWARRYFESYGGDDPEVLRFAAHMELFSYDEKHSIDWRYIQRLSMRARKIGVEMLFPVPGVRDANIPEAVCREVLSNCRSHCEPLVAVCEQSLNASVARTTEKVSM